MTHATSAESFAAARPGRLLALAGIISVSLGIRSAVTALSPITTEISADVEIGTAQFGIIGSVPLIFFAVASAGVPLILRFLGLEALMLASVGGMTVGQVLRAVSSDYDTMLVGSLITFLGVGTSNVLLPALVKRYFPDRIGAITALYAALLAISLMIPAALAVPITDTVGWRASLMTWAVLGAVAILPWALLVLRRGQRARDNLAPFSGTTAIVDFLRLWRSPTAWLLAGLLAATSLNAFVVFSWFPSILTERSGVSAAEAGVLVAVFSFIGIPLALVIPTMAARGVSVGVLVGTGAACFILGYLGLIVAPGASPLLWVTVIGIGPLLFPLCLVLANLRSRTERGAVALSSFMQAVGYLIASAWPTIMGLLHDLTGDWVLPLLALIVTALIAAVLGVLVNTSRFVEDEARMAS